MQWLVPYLSLTCSALRIYELCIILGNVVYKKTGILHLPVICCIIMMFFSTAVKMFKSGSNENPYMFFKHKTEYQISLLFKNICFYLLFVSLMRSHMDAMQLSCNLSLCKFNVDHILLFNLQLQECALLTDGRFSGGSHGFVVGHICPEAQVLCCCSKRGNSPLGSV